MIHRQLSRSICAFVSLFVCGIHFFGPYALHGQEVKEPSAAHLYEEGRRLARTGDYSAALEKFTAASEISPAVASYHHAGGKMLMHLGRFNEAKSMFESSLRCDKDYIQSHSGLARIAYIKRDFVTAIDHCDAYLTQRESAGLIQIRGWSKYSIGQYGDAERDGRTCLEHYPDSTGAYGLVSLSLLLQDRESEANDILETFASTVNDDDSSRYMAPLIRGHIALMERRSNDAFQFYSDAIAAAPKQSEPYHYRGLVHYCVGRYRDCIADCKSALAGSSLGFPHFNKTRTLILLAMAELDLGNLDAADAHLDTLARVAPKHSGMLAMKAVFAIYRDDANTAENALKMLQQCDLFTDFATYELARSFVENPQNDRQRIAEAVQLSGRLLDECADDDPNRRSYNGLHRHCKQALAQWDNPHENVDPITSIDVERPSFALPVTEHLRMNSSKMWKALAECKPAPSLQSHHPIVTQEIGDSVVE